MDVSRYIDSIYETLRMLKRNVIVHKVTFDTLCECRSKYLMQTREILDSPKCVSFYFFYSLTCFTHVKAVMLECRHEGF